MEELDEAIQKAVEGGEEKRGLNSLIGVLVALTATLMALTNIKGGLVVQESGLLQSRINDTWSLYQAKSTKQHLAENTREIFQGLQESGTGGGAAFAARITRYGAEAKRYDQEKEAIRRRAEAQEATRESLQRQHERFSVAEAILSLAMALFGLAALTQRRGLLALGLIFALLGLGAGVWGQSGGPGPIGPEPRDSSG